MDAVTLLQQVINGVSLGSLYALIAIGYTIVYGILRLINFAHGDLIMVSAYAAVLGVGLFAWPWWLSFSLAVAVTGLMGVLLERGAYRRLPRGPRISLLISAIAASFLLEHLALVIAGGRPQAFPVPQWFAGNLTRGGLYIPPLSLVIPAVTGVLLGGLFVLTYKTQVGRAMRAIAYDLETTSLMGVNVNRIIALAFLVGSLLAGAGGLLWAMKYPQVNPFMGIVPGLKAFIAAVLGGIGNLAGAVLGGLLLGLLEVSIVALFPDWAGYRDALAFLERNARPQDDFFTFVNGGWVARTEIPPDKSRVGSFNDLADRVAEQLRAIAEDGTRPDAPVPLRRLGAFYQAFMDEATAERAGVQPLAPELQAIDAIATYTDVTREFTRLARLGVRTPVLGTVLPDPDRPDTMALSIRQGVLGLPGREYYLGEEPAYAAAREQYARYVSTLLSLAKEAPAGSAGAETLGWL